MYLKYFLIFLGIHLATVTSKQNKFYRKDYTYISEYEAFYKLHIDNHTSWKTAFLTCENEQAELFYPSDDAEWLIVKKLREGMKESANVTDVLIGVHNLFNVGEFLTIDGDSPPVAMGDALQYVKEGEACVIMDSGTGSYEKDLCTRQSPTLFACKKLDKQQCTVSNCPTIDPDYKYFPQTGKCYKVNKYPKKWQEAMQICYMEGGLLAVAEVEMIFGSLNTDRYSTYFVGVRDLFHNGHYYTVRGKNVGDTPMVAHRSDNQHEPNPYNPIWNNGDLYDDDPVTERQQVLRAPNSLHCGAISNNNNNKIKATSCYDAMPFICEMEANKH